MLQVLWLEDEARWLERFAPVFASLNDVSTQVLFFGDRTEDYPPLNITDIPDCKDNGKLAWKRAYELVKATVKKVRPWLIIVDLKLDSVLMDDEVRHLGELHAPGINLTLELFADMGMQGFIWLTQYDNVMDHAADLATDPWPHSSNVGILRFPRTYVLDKTVMRGGTGADLLRILTKGAIDELRKTKALNKIQPSRITRLAELLLSVKGSLKHYVQEMNKSGVDGDRFRENLAFFDLLPNHYPPLSFATWCRTFDPEEKSFDTVTRISGDGTAEEVAKNLAALMGNSLWGMKVAELAELLTEAIDPRHTGTLGEIQSRLRTLDAGEKVIGPVIRDSILSALDSAVQNAVRHCGNLCLELLEGKEASALYLMVSNDTEDVSSTRRELARRDERKDLRGIHYIGSAIRELNSVHPCQTGSQGLGQQWGFGLVVDQCMATGDSFNEGAPIDEVIQWMETNGYGVGQVTAVFRFPLVHPNSLAEKHRSLARNSKAGE
jgi:hypothetical protein